MSDMSSSLFDLSLSYCYSPGCDVSWEMFSDVKFHSVRMDADNLTPLSVDLEAWLPFCIHTHTHLVYLRYYVDGESCTAIIPQNCVCLFTLTHP